jgi:dihydrofolate reductase
MTISLIAACSKNRVIGDGDKIPWHIPEDFKYFKEKTLGKPIIMGRATFESIHAMKGSNPHSGPALPKRKNVIVTRNQEYQPENCITCHSLEAAIEKALVEPVDEIMIIGGGTIYEQALPFAKRVYLTEIDKNYEGDVFFPELGDEWELTSSDPQGGYSFNIYERHCEGVTRPRQSIVS